MPHREPKKKNKIMDNTEEETKPEITLNDFAALLRIIDVASRRGAFEGKELSSVGSIRDKVEGFLKFYVPDEEESEEKEPKEKTVFDD